MLGAVNNCWTACQMKRQIDSMLYERLLLSNDKEAVRAMARKERIPETPQEIIKGPMVLEFLGLEKNTHYYESDLENELINMKTGITPTAKWVTLCLPFFQYLFFSLQIYHFYFSLRLPLQI